MNKRPTTRAGRRHAAEMRARANGYVGEWPPRRVTIHNAREFTHYLDRLAGGERRAGIIGALSRRIVPLHATLPVDAFARFGLELLVTLEDETAAARTHLRAAEGVGRVLSDGVVYVAELQARCPPWNHEADCLMRQVDAFVRAVTPEGMDLATSTLLRLAEAPRYAGIRAASVLLTEGLRRARAVVAMQEIQDCYAAGQEDARLNAIAQAELQRIEAELLAKDDQASPTKGQGH